MSAAKKITPDTVDPVNEKIQRKFDSVFTGTPKKEAVAEEIDFSDSITFETGPSGEKDMSNDEKNKKMSEETDIGIDLDFTLDDDAVLEKTSATQTEITSTNSGKPDELDFSIDFDLEQPEFERTPPAVSETPVSASESESEDAGFTLDDSDIGGFEIDDSTKKTVVANNAEMRANLKEFSLEQTGGGSLDTSSDHMSTAEAKANIETTIKDILRPEFAELDTSATLVTSGSVLDDIEDSVLDFRENTPPQGFKLTPLEEDDFTIDIGSKKETVVSSQSSKLQNDLTSEFSLDSLGNDFAPAEEVDEDILPMPTSSPVAASAPKVSAPVYDSPPSMGINAGSMGAEDSMRFQATIRALREEREELLANMKTMKSDIKELEQDNLTLKANLDEAKIEITILRKRHMVEVEDVKYRLSMSEEKKAMAEEKARQADIRREKLEQKVRIDFNQVKQREKELESKLELLSMDVDSQVQSRDHKILELRRKIDALEFNMENVSIKEQKSLDDKRKLEDRLNKIMKTLRHSIKNLEDDIDHVVEEDDHQKDKN